MNSGVAVARDIAIIVLAFLSIVIGVLLAVMIVQIQRLIKMLRQEIKPVIDSTNQTVSTVRGTTTFISRHLVSPIIEVSGFVSGLRRTLQLLADWPKGDGSRRPAENTPPGNGSRTAGEAPPSPET